MARLERLPPPRRLLAQAERASEVRLTLQQLYAAGAHPWQALLKAVAMANAWFEEYREEVFAAYARGDGPTPDQVKRLQQQTLKLAQLANTAILACADEKLVEAAQHARDDGGLQLHVPLGGLDQLSAALVPALGEERVAALRVWLHGVIGRELAAMEGVDPSDPWARCPASSTTRPRRCPVPGDPGQVDRRPDGGGRTGASRRRGRAVRSCFRASCSSCSTTISSILARLVASITATPRPITWWWSAPARSWSVPPWSWCWWSEPSWPCSSAPGPWSMAVCSWSSGAAFDR